jgi:ADP-ribose pyrophosphatase YjhB (NUDIX family)
MKFCSTCGSKVRLKKVDSDERLRYVCTTCGVVHYVNPKIIVSCLVYWRKKLLVCRRASEPARGQWTVPSGFLEVGETLQEAAVRETFEETRVSVPSESLELYTVISMPALQQVVISFRARLRKKQTPHPGPESLEASFLSEDEMKSVDIAWRESLPDQPTRFWRELRSGHFTIKLASTLRESQAARKIALPLSRRYHSAHPAEVPTRRVRTRVSWRLRARHTSRK